MTQRKTDSHPHSPLEAVPQEILSYHGEILFPRMARWRVSGRIPPVLLLTGQPGIGKRALSYALAQWILCESTSNPDHPAPCQTCFSCQSLAAGNHTAFTELTPAEDSDTLKIEQFRDLKATIGFGTYHHHARVILIPHAEKMTPQAANSMLKLLEETPRGWQFILTTHDATLLLPTLISRCQTIKLKPVSTAIIQDLLNRHQVDSTRAQACAEISQGSWDRALKLAQEETWEKRKDIFKFIESPHQELNPLLDWVAQKPTNFETLIDLLEQFTLELLFWASQNPLPSPQLHSWNSADLSHSLATYAQNETRRRGGLTQAQSFWFDRAERLAQCRFELSLPLNRKILAQDVLFPWLEPS